MSEETMSNRPGPVRPPSAALLAGVARRDITPPIGIYARNWGAARHDVAEGIHRPLTATVLAMRSGADAPPLILASIDATWWQGRHEEWQTRGAVLVELGLPPEAVMISCSHT